MVKIAIVWKPELENLESIGPEGEDFRFYLDVRCNHCGEVRSDVFIDESEKHPLMSGRGEANLVMKCKLCQRAHYMDIIKGSVKPYTSESSGMEPLVVFECRGMEPVAWYPRNGFVAHAAESSTVFDDVDLSDEWAEYDEAKDQSVSVMDVPYEFTKM
eukprot:GCRY01002000.1.p2 GENE.GCRY01002000.1~~GCRY01002000.1.p2  ORF type:complete len:158 (-),score=33.85 GCRY01002000.1:28-501(-)